jgi:hypothetical protein
LIPLAGAVLVGALLAAPWIYRAWSFARGDVKAGAVLPSLEAAERLYFPNYLGYLWHLLGPARSYLLLYVAPLGLVGAALHRRTRAFSAWAAALGLLSLPLGVYLAPFRPDHSVIVLFIPINLLVAGFSVAAGDFLISLARRRLGQYAWAAALPVGAAVAALLVWGLWETGSIINPATVLATQADVQAVRWIDGHTPPEARFFINVALWQYGVYRGVDGGWWISPLTGRDTLLPPVMYPSGEKEYVARVNAQAKQASQLQGCSPEFWELLRAASLTHIYLGKTNGPLRPEGLAGCPNLRLVYAQDGVSIYQVGK